MIDSDYENKRTLQRRIGSMQAWVDSPELLTRDENADVIEIDLNQIKELILWCPNDPDDVKLLSEIGQVEVDEVFIGSCMTNIGHYRAAGKVLEDVTNGPTSIYITIQIT